MGAVLLVRRREKELEEEGRPLLQNSKEPAGWGARY